MTDSIIKSLIGSSIILFLAACALLLPSCTGLSQNTKTAGSNYVSSSNISKQDKQQAVASHSDENYDVQIREQENHSDGYGNTFTTGADASARAAVKTTTE